MSEQLQPVPAAEWVQISEVAEMQDGEIISGLRCGDQNAWTTLYDSYSVRIWGYVAKLVGPNVASVADIVHETMLAAAQSAQSFDDTRGTLWQWLSGVAHNSVSKYWRAEKQANRLRQLAESHDEHQKSSLQLLIRSTEAPGDHLERQELANIVRAALAQLPVDYAALLTAKYIDELSLAEIQQQTGNTSDAVRSKMVRARSEFRDVFQRITHD